MILIYILFFYEVALFDAIIMNYDSCLVYLLYNGENEHSYLDDSETNGYYPDQISTIKTLAFTCLYNTFLVLEDDAVIRFLNNRRRMASLINTAKYHILKYKTNYHESTDTTPYYERMETDVPTCFISYNILLVIKEYLILEVNKGNMIESYANSFNVQELIDTFVRKYNEGRVRFRL
jgi:hypothetical protein